MKIKKIEPEILVLEYRQDHGDKDYGSCLWARFYFNLDEYELLVTSDCDNYSYTWCQTPDSESFLELMARIGEQYLLEKFCGRPKFFDYEATKEHFYELYADEEEDKAKLDEIFENIESEYEPQSAETFLRMFDEYNVDDHCRSYFSDVWEMPVYVYSAQQEKICQVFHDFIQPQIKEMVKDTKKEKKK